MSKYKNVKTVVDGIKFDSKLEAKRYGELKRMERESEIENLQIHPKFVIEINGQKICTIIPDFMYEDLLGVAKVEDTKSPVTAKTKDDRLKKKLLKACHGLDIVEIFK